QPPEGGGVGAPVAQGGELMRDQRVVDDQGLHCILRCAGETCGIRRPILTVRPRPPVRPENRGGPGSPSGARKGGMSDLMEACTRTAAESGGEERAWRGLTATMTQPGRICDSVPIMTGLMGWR